MTGDLLAVPGARLHHRLRGSGPLLLMLQAGDGRAEGTDNLAEHLQDRWTVLSYDRRGLVRSPLDDPASVVDLSIHADDASRLLSSCTDRPAVVFGASIGAVIGLELLRRHPGQVALLVAHEPPVVALLPDDERSAAEEGQHAIESTLATGGPAAAMQQFLTGTGIDPTDREPDAPIPPVDPDRARDVAFFLRRDAPAVARYRPDRDVLGALGDRIVPAVGERSAHLFPGRCALALAALLGTTAAEFPGGHSGFALRPRAFAARLAEVLERGSTGVRQVS